MITLTLLHPSQSTPVQSWTFGPESVIRIGRSKDNDIIIFSSVVSRNHVELWNNGTEWEIINFGANGTYVDNEAIAQRQVVDGMIFRLGSSGPKIKILLDKGDPDAVIKKEKEKRQPDANTEQAFKESETYLTSRRGKSIDEES